MRKDILIDNGEPVIENGDFKVGASDDQHVELILAATPGQFKSSPLVGLGLANYLKQPSTAGARLKRDLSVALEADGYKVKELYLDNGSFDLDYELNY